MNNEIPNADLIRAALDGKQGQAKNAKGEWVDCTPRDFVSFCSNWSNHEALRLKPDNERSMIRVNGVVVPKHETKAPEYGTKYYIPVIQKHTGPLFYECSWLIAGHPQLYWLDAGLVYLNANYAQARAEAMLKWEEVE